MKRLFILFMLCLLMFPSYVFATTPSSYCAGPEQSDMLIQLNQYRAANGVPPLQADAVLGAAAQDHAIDNGMRNMLSHNMADGSSFADNIFAHGWVMNSWLGEDLAGSYQSAQGTLGQFENSPSHNEILLDPKYVAIGVGRYDDGGLTQARYWWALDFASDIQQPLACSANPPSPATPTNVPVKTATVVPTQTTVPTRVPTSTPKPKKCPPKKPGCS